MLRFERRLQPLRFPACTKETAIDESGFSGQHLFLPLPFCRSHFGNAITNLLPSPHFTGNNLLVSRLRPLSLLLSLFLVACAAVDRPLLPLNLFTDQSQSPDTGCHQGYATDGTSNFLFDTHRILKRANDTTWHITGVNDKPFEGLTGYDHIGDGDYFEGLLYVPVEFYASCGNDRNPAIFIFDAASLVRLRVIDLPVATEVSGVAVLPAHRELWVTSYCDGSQLWVYDVDTFELKRTLKLEVPLATVQGLAYREPYFYVAQNDGRLFRVSLEGDVVQVFKTNSPGAHEGLDYSQQELRWLIDEGLGEQKIHFLVPK